MRLQMTLSALLFAASAQAQAPTLHLVVGGSIPGERLRSALERDLSQPVVLGDGPAPRLVVGASDGLGTLAYSAADGAERRREIALSADPDERLRELTLVASNLARDQTSSLIASPLAPAPIADDASSPPAPDEALPDPPPSNLALASPFHLGLSGLLGVAVTDDGTGSTVQPFGGYGLSLTGTIDRMVSIGVTRLSLNPGYSSVEGALFSFQGTPMVEVFGFPDARVQVYGQLGVAVQGATATQVRDASVNVAPFLGGGVRFWVTDWFTLGVELGLHLVVTDTYSMGSASLPQWSLPGTLGLNAEFHIR